MLVALALLFAIAGVSGSAAAWRLPLTASAGAATAANPLQGTWWLTSSDEFNWDGLEVTVSGSTGVVTRTPAEWDCLKGMKIWQSITGGPRNYVGVRPDFIHSIDRDTCKPWDKDKTVSHKIALELASNNTSLSFTYDWFHDGLGKVLPGRATFLRVGGAPGTTTTTKPTTTTAPPSGSGSITGRVTDGTANRYDSAAKTSGQDHPLPFAYVRVTYGSNWKGAIADENGNYKVTGLPTGKVAGFDPKEDAYRVEVWLQFMVDLKQAPAYRVLYRAKGGKVVRAVTKAFVLTPGGVRKDINFGRTPADLQLNLSQPVKPDQLPDLAAIYFHSYQALRLAGSLGQKVLRPWDVVGYAPESGGAWWEGPMTSLKGTWSRPETIVVPVGRSAYYEGNRPMNREWHEYGHQYQANLLGRMPRFPGDGNHDGYCKNRSSSDAWTEGFAEFFSLMVAREVAKIPRFSEYRARFGVTELEADWQAWQDEEYALAGLLLDLVDGPKDYGGWFNDDPVQIPLKTLIAMIAKGTSAHPSGNGHIFDMLDLYQSLGSLGVTDDGRLLLDKNKNGRSDIADVFIQHGFFQNADGDQTYEKGEKIGFTDHGSTVAGQPCTAVAPRRETPPEPGSFIAVRTTEPNGKAVTGVTFTIRISYSPPYTRLGFSYTVSSIAGGRLYLVLAPIGSKAVIVASAPGRKPSKPFVLDSKTYWQKLSGKANVPILAHTFTLVPLKSTTTTTTTTTTSPSGSVQGAVAFTAPNGSLGSAVTAPRSANGLSANIDPQTGVIVNALWLKDGDWLARITVPAGATGLGFTTSPGVTPGTPLTRPKAATNFRVLWSQAGVITSAAWWSVGKLLAPIPVGSGRKAIAFTNGS